MRKKIGKRIGPVPITLVAVFALAALISTGLLFAVNGAQTAEAQDASCTIGLADNSADPQPSIGEECDFGHPWRGQAGRRRTSFNPKPRPHNVRLGLC